MKKQLSKKLAAFIVTTMMFSGSMYAQWNITTNPPHIFNTNTGNVGIGTSAPSGKLHVNVGLVTTQPAVKITGTDVRMTMNNTTFQTLSSGNNLSINALVTNIAATPGNLILQTNNQPFLFQRTGNVGIGTSSPLQKLHVTGASILANNTTINPNSITNAVIAGNIQDSIWYVNSGIGGKGNTTGSTWGLGVNSSGLFLGYGNGTTANTMQTALQVTPSRNVLLTSLSGNVGIGNTTPTSKLDVKSNTTNPVISARTTYVGNSDVRGLYSYSKPVAGFGIGIEATGGYKGGLFYSDVTGVQASASSNTGNHIGVNASATGAGGVNYGVYSSASGGVNNWAFYGIGSSLASGGTWQTSDAKLKKDVKSVENAMDMINKLQPRTYNYKTDEFKNMALPSEKQYGFIAQELETVFPEMVRNVEQPTDNGKDDRNTTMFQFKAVNYTELIPVLTKAIQEQNVVIAELKERLDNMEKANQSNTAKAGKPQAEGAATETTLYQNAPNPFNENTTIRYNVPVTCRQAAIKVMSMEGRELQTIPVIQKGAGQVVVSANSLANGNYIYQLVVDGKMSSNKKMVLVK